MRKPIRKSLLYLAVIQAIGAGVGLPALALSADTGQPSVATAFAQSRDLQRELIGLKKAVVESPDDAELRFRLGVAYLGVADATSAEKELIRARRLGFEDYALRLALGETWIAQGEFRRVFTDDALLNAQGPDQTAALKTLQGQSLTVQGRTDEARDHFVDALAQVEGYGPALLAIAEAELTDDEIIAAQQAMSRARVATDLDPVELLRVEGNLAFKLGRFDEAVLYYRQALSKRDGDPILLRGLAVSQLRQDKPEQADETLDRLLAMNPSNGDAIALKAQAALRMRDYQTAAELAGAVVGIGNDERRAGPLLTAGAASLFNGSPQQAREYLSRYLAQRPDDQAARRLLGDALLRLGDKDAAYEVLEPLADTAGDDTRLLSALALAAAGSGAPEAAVAYLERAVSAAPDNPALQAQLAAAKIGTEDRTAGLAELEQLAREHEGLAASALEAAVNRLAHGEFDAALSGAREIQAVAPDALAPKLVAGLALLRQGDLQAAGAAFTAVIEQQPDNVAARTGLAEIQLRRGNTGQALSRFEDLALKHPQDPTTGLNLALAELQAGRTLQGTERLERIVADAPESTAARMALAQVYLNDGLPERTLELLRSAQDPTTVAVRLATAQAELMLGRPAAAIAILQGLAREAPASVDAHLILAQAYERNAQPAEAQQSLERAAKTAPQEPAVRYAILRRSLLQPGLPEDELEQTVDDTTSFIEAAPGDPRAQILRALVLFRMEGQRERALALLSQLNQALPSLEVANILARLSVAMGRADDAVAVLDRQVAGRPEDIDARLRLARAQIAAGAYAQAADNLVTSMEQGASQPNLALATAWSLAKADRPAEARAYLNQAEAEGASGTMLLQTRGLLRLSSGDARGAVTSLQDAVKGVSGPAPSQLQLDLAKALAAAGDAATARRMLDDLRDLELSDAHRAELDALETRLR